MKTTKFDAAKYLINEERIAEYLSAILEENPDSFPKALGTVVRARGVSETAKQTGLSRETLYSALDDGGNPTLSTINKILRSFNVKLNASRVA
jgi:probable addiction module antidote protein